MRSDLGARLKRVRAHRTQPEMGRVMGIAHRTYASYERNERMPDADAIGRLVDEGWNANWLLTGDGPERLAGTGVAEEAAVYQVASQDLSGEHLSIAIELADEALQGLWLPKRRYADLVALIYDALTQGLPYAEILDFARPVAEKQAQQGAGDVGEKGVDPAGPGRTGRGAGG